VDYIIPGNDDSIRAVQLYMQNAAAAILEGKTQDLGMGQAASEDEFVEMDADAETPAAE
jgi:small subunit ribosomal protein S2